MKYIDKLLQGAEVEWKPLGEISTQISGMSGVSNKWASSGNCRFIDYLNAYKHIKIDIHQLPFATVKKLNQTELRQGDILFTSASETPDECAISSVIEDKISSGIFLDDHLFGIRINEKYKGIIDSSFLNYYFHSPDFRKTVNKAVRGVTRFYISKVAFMRLSIPIPPLSVQRKLVEILDKFTELEAELDCRKRQYEYYRNKLLAFNMLNTHPEKLNNVIWLKMGDIAEIYGGLTGKSKIDFGIGDAYFIPYKNIFDHNAVKLDKLEKVRVDIGERQHNVKYGDVLFTGSSETPEEVGMSSAITTDLQSNVYLNSVCFGVRFKEGIELIPEFSKFLFRSPFMCHQIYKTANGVTRFNISKERFKKILIPLPPLSEQQRIVSILDKFDTLTSSISEGLPKEIELRRKQYEYYREQLLSFRH